MPPTPMPTTTTTALHPSVITLHSASAALGEIFRQADIDADADADTDADVGNKSHMHTHSGGSEREGVARGIVFEREIVSV